MNPRTAAAAIAGMIAFATPPARAQPADDDQAAASKLAAEGIAKFDARDFAGALTLFQQAWAIYTGDPVLLSFMGQAAEEMGSIDAAIHYYEEFLKWGPDPADAGAAQTALTRLRAIVPPQAAPVPSGGDPIQAPPNPPPETGPSMAHAALATAVAIAAASGALYARSRFQDAAADGEEAIDAAERSAYEDAKERGESAAIAFYALGVATATAAGWASYVWLSLPDGASTTVVWGTQW